MNQLKSVKRLWLLTLVAALIFALPVLGSASSLDKGKWHPANLERLRTFITEHGNTNPNYKTEPDKGPYAVFDWDQTSIFNDTQEAMFRYMIENLLFKATPEEFAKAIRHDVPKDNFKADYNNKAGQPVNIDLIAADIDKSYAFLYENYIKNQAKSLKDIHATEEFIDFRGKLAYLYEAIGGSFSAEVSYPWLNYLFVGMTVKEVQQVAEQSNDYALGDKLETYTLTSSEKLPGKAGVVSLDGYKRGLRLAPEMSNLMNALRANGIEVYVCSASHEAVVRVFAGLDKYGYRIPPENVIAMKTKIDKNGRFMAEYDYTNDYPQTQQKGKTKAIKQILVAKYGHGPVLIAGDSQGDYNMSVDFPETDLVVLINRVRKDDFGKLGLEALKDQNNSKAKFILQGRNENIGQFRPDQATIKLGQKEPQLLHKELQ